MMLSLDTAYRSFGGEVEALSTPTICRLPDSRRHQLSAIAPERPLGASSYPPAVIGPTDRAKAALMHTLNLGGPLDNKLLSALPRGQFDLLGQHLTTVSLSQG